MDNLNKKLREWDAGIKRNSNDDLKMKIMSQLENTSTPEPIKFESHFVIPKKLAYAASLLIVGILTFLLTNRNGGKGAQSLLAISSQDLAAIKKINNELKFVFPGGIRAAYRSNGQLIIDTENSDNIVSQKNLLIRYVVVKKGKGEFWEQVGVSDVIAASNNPIMLNGDSIKGEIWNHRMDKEVYALENSLKLVIEGCEISVASFGGQQLNKPHMIKEFTQGEEKFQVYQTVVEI